MKSRFSFSVIAIIGLGVLLGILILQIEPRTSLESGDHEHANRADDISIARGPHGGWLFSDADFQLEVLIYEKGIPPQFRVYPGKASGGGIPPGDVDLIIKLQRLDRVDSISFKPTPDFLMGHQTVEEPHSFEVDIKAHWQGKDYAWHFSQIEARAELSPEVLATAGIGIATAGPGKIKTTLQLTGEIGLNEERVVHIVPRLDGVVRKVFKDLGDQVKEGELLAILESRELADAKINFLGAVKQSKLAMADLEREKLVYENTQTMLNLLEQQPDLEEVYERLKNLVIGRNRELLIPAYSKLQLARSIHKREKRLHEKGISSESEYLLALEAYKSAEARYMALREKFAYDGDWTIRQKQRTAEMEQLNLQTANQKLLALGLSTAEMERLGAGEENILTQYELRSSLRGTIIQKHLTTGEALKKDDNIFVLADLSDVWVNIAIPAKNLQAVKLGQKVRAKSEQIGMEGTGSLTYLSSIIDEKTRTVTGRVVIPNPQKNWRPGAFVSVELTLEERAVPVAVKIEAIQNLRDWTVVFVKYGSLFEGRPLQLGASDGAWIEVLNGLSPGENYVVKNSFAVKAEIEKSGATHQH
ncbi:MAG: efflux RND transporter periplasmic adaptor subunit [Nitrospinaceae bacterium]